MSNINCDFTASTAYPLFLRSYSRTALNGQKETVLEAKNRAIEGLESFGSLTNKDLELIIEYFYKNIIFPSGRWFWIGGTGWVKQQKNFIGAYNCASVPVDSWEAFRFNFRALLMGCGVGTIVEEHIIDKLSSIKYPIEVVEITELGTNWVEGDSTCENSHYTAYKIDNDTLGIIYTVGDSKEGWVDVATDLLEFSSISLADKEWKVDYKKINLSLDLSYVRPKGKVLKSFGGLSNPDKLISGLLDMIKIINGAVGRKLNSLECCKLLDIAGVITVVADIRRSALLHQGSPDDENFTNAKLDLWSQDEEGNWKVDPERDMLRMANLTVSYHIKPDLETTIEAVRKQFYSGEGAIQYVPEAVARANADLLDTLEKKKEFINAYVTSIRKGANYLKELSSSIDDRELEHRIKRLGLNPCQTGDTLIATANGLIPIQDLVGKTFETSVDLRTIGLSGVVQTQAIAFSTGIQTVYEVKLANGLSVKSTANHQHFTDKGWIETKDLTTSHRVLFQKGEGKWSEDSKNDITLEQSQMLGWWYGDGYNVKVKGNSNGRGDYLAKGFVFSPKEYLTAATTVLHALETITDHRYIPRLHKGVFEFKSCSLLLSDWFDNLNIKTKDELPTNFFQEKRETIIGFLQGLFSADGTVEHGNSVSRRIKLVNKSKKLIEQIQILLLNLGIVSSTRCAVVSGAKGVPYTLKDGTEKVSKNNGHYTLSICTESFNRFVEVIGFPLCPLKQEVAELWAEKPLINYLKETVNKRYSSKVVSIKEIGEEPVFDLHVPLTHSFISNGIVTHNCGEIIGNTFLCNLADVHTNLLDPLDIKQQEEAFRASTLAALPLLQHEFDIEELRYSREIDPIIGVCITGLFDFFVNLFGADWLRWWKTGRSRDYEKANYFLETEREYLTRWKNVVRDTVVEFCGRNGMRVPNRYTAIAPSGCWNVDAVRILDSGILYMDELLEPAKGVQSLNLSVRQGVPVKSGIANDLLPTKKIVLLNGRELVLTLDHKLSVNSDWVKAEDLQVGDILDIQVGEYNNTIECPLKDFTQKLHGNSEIYIDTPKEMSPKLAYLLGVIDGNGCFSSSHRIRITHGDLGILEYTSSLFLELFGFGGNIKQGNNKKINSYELCVASESISNWFKINDLDKRTKSKYLNRLHLAVRCSSKQSILAYFAGLIDTDGCIHKNGHCSISSASEDFLRNLQQIGECVGLCFKIRHDNKGASFQGNRDMWKLEFLKMISLPKAVDLVNSFSYKARNKPMGKVLRQFKHTPFQIVSVEDGELEYTYDISIDSEQDDNCWYWQGAIKSHNSKSLLTGASAGWHPPKATRYIRRITYRVNDPVALACRDYGYNIIPSQDCKDEEGNLLNDPNDPRVTEWLVEIPVEVNWAKIGDEADFNPKDCSALAQLDFYMQVHNFYTTHSSSATIELSEDEIEPLGTAIYDLIQNDEGYISAALLAKFEAKETFPRLPFEPITEAKYLELMKDVKNRQVSTDFVSSVNKYSKGLDFVANSGSAGCDSDKCLLPEKR